MNAEVEKWGCLYLLPKVIAVEHIIDERHEVYAGDEAISEDEYTTDQIVTGSVCELLGIPGENQEKQYNKKFFESVFNYMYQEYENSGALIRTSGLDVCIKEMVKSCSLEVFFEITTFDSIYDAIISVIKYAIGVIQMSDDCSALIDVDNGGIFMKVREFVLRERRIHEEMFAVDYGRYVGL